MNLDRSRMLLDIFFSLSKRVFADYKFRCSEFKGKKKQIKKQQTTNIQEKIRREQSRLDEPVEAAKTQRWDDFSETVVTDLIEGFCFDKSHLK